MHLSGRPSQSGDDACGQGDNEDDLAAVRTMFDRIESVEDGRSARCSVRAFGAFCCPPSRQKRLQDRESAFRRCVCIV